MEVTGTLYVLCAAAAFVWGAIWGSFLNVVIHRLPEGRSLVRPASHCPRCEHTLAWWQNVPIFGWLLLRGRCHYCREPISVRYPLVELLTAVLSVAVLLVSVRSVPSAELYDVLSLYLYRFIFVGLLVAITFIDLDLRIIPHELTITGMVVGFGGSFLFGRFTGVGFAESGIGALIGGGIIFLIIQVYFWVRKREGMGGGDFMMMGMLGAWLGYESILFIMFASSMQGTLAAVVLFATGRGHEAAPTQEAPSGDEVPAGDPDGPLDEDASFRTMEVPFGPFLAVAALEWVFFEPQIRALLFAWTDV